MFPGCCNVRTVRYGTNVMKRKNTKKQDQIRLSIIKKKLPDRTNHDLTWHMTGGKTCSR